jgi:hypothetical protein
MQISKLKNYASESSLNNIFSSIEKTLVSHGAKQIVRDYDADGRVVSISFLVTTPKGDFGVRLPARVERVKALFDQQRVKYKPDQPYRTAWATIRDWISAQMALLDWEAVKLEEIFLPYMVHRDGRTFFETMERRGFYLTDESSTD